MRYAGIDLHKQSIRLCVVEGQDRQRAGVGRKRLRCDDELALARLYSQSPLEFRESRDVVPYLSSRETKATKLNLDNLETSRFAFPSISNSRRSETDFGSSVRSCSAVCVSDFLYEQH